MKLTTRFQLSPRLRMSGAVLLLPLYAFMVLTGKYYLLYFDCCLEYDPIQYHEQRFRFCSCFLFEAVLTLKIVESLSFETT
jgi:hypothetical protein